MPTSQLRRTSQLPLTWWQRFVAWLRRLLSPQRALPAPRAKSAELPLDLHEQLQKLSPSGVVRDTVDGAVEDYRHLRDVMVGPGATIDAVDDAVLLARAQSTLRGIIERAASVQVLVDVASERGDDRAGREAAGDAVLSLRDDARLLHDTASAALRWASSRSGGDETRLRECADRLAGAE